MLTIATVDSGRCPANFLRWLELGRVRVLQWRRNAEARTGIGKGEPTLSKAKGGQLISRDSTEPLRSWSLLSSDIFASIGRRPAVPAVVA